jgi:hypothetical protein
VSVISLELVLLTRETSAGLNEMMLQIEGIETQAKFNYN